MLLSVLYLNLVILIFAQALAKVFKDTATTQGMESQQLYDKYQLGKHWEQHPTCYAESFAVYLGHYHHTGLVLDVGCGTGRDVHVFCQRGFEGIGIDNSPTDIAQARKKHPLCRFQEMNVEQLSLEDASIGAFYMVNVIHYVQQQQALQELNRVLRPEGFGFIHFNMLIRDENGSVDYQQDKDEILALVSDFDVVTETEFERVDSIPVEHTHTILELLLQKK